MPLGPFIILSEVDSTNNYAMAKLHTTEIEAGSCFQAVEQSAGKGQRGRQWMSSKGSNITMSVCVRPTHPDLPFLLSAAMALGCYDFIKECGIKNVAVKWPNDLYINDKKAAGILIENSVLGMAWKWAVVGIGVNVNQSHFGDLENRATSLKRELTGPSSDQATSWHRSPADLDVTALAKRLHQHLLSALYRTSTQQASEIMEQYNAALYLRGREVRVRKASAVFKTVIERVTAFGDLITNDVIERQFTVGEIEFV